MPFHLGIVRILLMKLAYAAEPMRSCCLFGLFVCCHLSAAALSFMQSAKLAFMIWLIVHLCLVAGPTLCPPRWLRPPMLQHHSLPGDCYGLRMICCCLHHCKQYHCALYRCRGHSRCQLHRGVCRLLVHNSCQYFPGQWNGKYATGGTDVCSFLRRLEAS